MNSLKGRACKMRLFQTLLSPTSSQNCEIPLTDVHTPKTLIVSPFFHLAAITSRPLLSAKVMPRAPRATVKVCAHCRQFFFHNLEQTSSFSVHRWPTHSHTFTPHSPSLLFSLPWRAFRSAPSWFSSPPDPATRPISAPSRRISPSPLPSTTCPRAPGRSGGRTRATSSSPSPPYRPPTLSLRWTRRAIPAWSWTSTPPTVRVAFTFFSRALIPRSIFTCVRDSLSYTILPAFFTREYTKIQAPLSVIHQRASGSS